MTVYALLVGIDDYAAASPLHGSLDDIERVREFLAARVPGGAVEKVLPSDDDEATRAAMIDGIRRHLGRAGPGDVALFWFSGHGGEAPVPDEYWHLEPGGYLQTLVCADSRTLGPDGKHVPDLVDKELRVLLDEVAARGPHVVVVLDCCYSAGATRAPDVTVRGAGRASERLPMSAYLPEWTHGVDGTGWSHVVLAACRSHEKAQEQPIDGHIRGVFSHALLRALETLGEDATYRDLVGVARCTVQNLTPDQSPVLVPAEAGLADQPFLGGRIRRPAAFRLVYGPSGWEVDAGRCHGIPEPVPDDPLLFAVPDGAGWSGLLRVTEVRPASSLVEPEGWTPDRKRAHPVVVASVPLPRAAVVLGGLPGDDAAAADRVRTAVGCAGPGDRPSLDVRVVAEDEPIDGLRLRVAAPEVDGRRVFQILRADGEPATPDDVPGHTAAAAARVVARLEHISRWTHLKQLVNPASGLTDAVRVEVIAACDEDRVVPRDRPPILPDGRGEIRVSYRRVGDRWEPPKVFVRLHNTSGRRLWCILLDLNDRYGSHASLFSGAFVGPGEIGTALEGRRINVSLPRNRLPEPGTPGRDWLKLIVAEEQVNSLAFEMPALDQPSTRGFVRALGFVDRLGLRATTRDMGEVPAGGAGGDWVTAIVPLVCEVPAG